MSAKPAILIYGNGQAEHLGHIALQLVEIGEAFEIRVIPSHLVTESDWATRFDEAFFANVRVAWNQVESGEPTAHRRLLESRLPPNCRTVTFPLLTLSCLWPFSDADPRVARAGDDAYPWFDSVAASLDPAVTGEDPPDDLLFEAYLRLSTEKMPDLEHRLRLDAARARALDEHADIRMWDWIEERFRASKLFHTPTHPTAAPFGYLIPRLLALTEGLSAVQIARAQREAAFLMRGYPGQDIETVPVHPVIAERLGLTWFDPDARHRWHSHAWTHREYTLKYIRREPFMP